jgi:hypothetical protein
MFFGLVYKSNLLDFDNNTYYGGFVDEIIAAGDVITEQLTTMNIEAVDTESDNQSSSDQDTSVGPLDDSLGSSQSDSGGSELDDAYMSILVRMLGPPPEPFLSKMPDGLLGNIEPGNLEWIIDRNEQLTRTEITSSQMATIMYQGLKGIPAERLTASQSLSLFEKLPNN